MAESGGTGTDQAPLLDDTLMSMDGQSVQSTVVTAYGLGSLAMGHETTEVVLGPEQQEAILQVIRNWHAQPQYNAEYRGPYFMSFLTTNKIDEPLAYCFVLATRDNPPDISRRAAYKTNLSALTEWWSEDAANRGMQLQPPSHLVAQEAGVEQNGGGKEPALPSQGGGVESAMAMQDTPSSSQSAPPQASGSFSWAVMEGEGGGKTAPLEHTSVQHVSMEPLSHLGPIVSIGHPLDQLEVHPVTSDGLGETAEGSYASPDSIGSDELVEGGKRRARNGGKGSPPPPSQKPAPTRSVQSDGSQDAGIEEEEEPELPFALRLQGDMPFDHFGEGELERRFTRRQEGDRAFVGDLITRGTELLGALTYFGDPRRGHQFVFHVGEGAAGRVYACSTEDGRPAALKTLFLGMMEGTEAEGRRVALCPSAYEEMAINQARMGMIAPFVVPTFAVGAFSAHPKWLLGVVLMELCDGSYGNLPQYLQRVYFPSMLNALLKGGKANHDLGIIMVDLTPKNVMVSYTAGEETPCMRCADYSHAMRLLTPDGTVPLHEVPRLEYASPELLVSDWQADKSSDVYLMGMAILEKALGLSRAVPSDVFLGKKGLAAPSGDDEMALRVARLQEIHFKVLPGGQMPERTGMALLEAFAQHTAPGDFNLDVLQALKLDKLLPQMLRYHAIDRISLAEAVDILNSERRECPAQWLEEAGRQDPQLSLPEAVRHHLWEAQLEYERGQLGDVEEEEEEEEAVDDEEEEEEEDDEIRHNQSGHGEHKTG